MDYTNSFSEQDIKPSRGMGVLSYLGALWLIPFILRRQNPYVRFHLNQGLLVFLGNLIVTAVANILKGAFTLVGFGFAANLVNIAHGLIGFIFVALMIIGIINVINERAKELPIIGKIRLIK